MVGSAATSASNCSSGTSTSIFLPSGPTAWTVACSSSAVTALFAGAFLAVAFLAGVAVAFLAAAFLDAALAVLAVDFRVVAVDELEDTNYLSVRHVGRTRARQSPYLSTAATPFCHGHPHNEASGGGSRAGSM